MTGVAGPEPGLLRRAASGVLRHFVDHGALEPDGLLRLGWHGGWPALRQAYSGPGSPYWAAKGEPALEPVRNRTPTRRLVTMEDIVGAVVFLLENRSVNGENLHVDGGWLLL